MSEKRVTGVGEALSLAVEVADKLGSERLDRVFPANALAPRDPLLARPLEKVAAALIEQAAAALHGGTTKGPTHAWCGDCGAELQLCECGVVRRIREAVHVALSDGRLVPGIRTSEGAGGGRWVETTVNLADINPPMALDAEWLEKPIPEMELKRNRAERRRAKALARRRTR